MENKHIQKFFHQLCRTVLVQRICKSMNYWDLLSTVHSIMYICATAVRCSGSYALPSERDSNGVCGCHCSAYAGLRSISPAALFHRQPNLQMEGRLHTSKAQVFFLDQIQKVSCSFKECFKN